MQKQTLDDLSWDADAMCFGHSALQLNPDLFYGFCPEDVATAKEICAECPVIDDCLVFGLGSAALRINMIYGGYTLQERLDIAQQKNTA